jgi:autotransporter translocation and assembly factor TamB
MGRGTRILLGLLSGAALLALTLSTLLLALSLGFQRERLRQAVETTLSRTLGTEVAIGALEGRLVPDLVLRGVRIGPEEDPQIELGRLAVRLAGYAPTRGHLSVESFEAQGVRWALAPRGARASDSVPPPEAAVSGVAWLRRVEVGRVELREIELEVVWGDAPSRMQVHAGGYAERLEWPASDASIAAIEARVAGQFTGPKLYLGSRPLGAAHGRIAARLSGGELRLETLEAGVGTRALSLEGEAVVGLRGDGLDVEGLRLAGEAGSLAISGGIALEAFHDLSVTARGIDVATIAPLFELPIEVAGHLDADIRLDGTLDRPDIAATGSWEDARVGHMRRGRFRIDLQARDRELRTDIRGEMAGAEVGHASIRLDYDEALRGELSLTSDLEVEVRSEELELALLKPLLPRPLRSLEGVGRIDLRLRGGAVPSAQGWLEVEDGSLELPVLGRSLAPFQARLELRPDAQGLRVEALRAETPLGDLEGSGVVTTDGLREFALALRGLDAAALALQLGAPSEVGGEISADVRFDGPFARPELSGALVWSQPRVGQAAAGRLALEVDADDVEVRGVAHLVESDRDALLARATLPRPERVDPGSLLGPGARIEVEGIDFDLSTLSPFLPRQLRDVAGRADLELRAEGGQEGPQLSGELRISDGALSVPLLGARYEPIEGRIRLDGRTLLPELRVGAEERLATLGGRIELDGLTPAASDLELTLERFALARSHILQADVSGAMQLTGPVDALVLLGSLRLDQGRVRVPDAEDPALREIRIVTREALEGDTALVEQRPTRPGALDRARVELTLELPRNTWVRGRGLEIELDGDLGVEKSPLGPLRYVGTVNVVRGRYELLGKRFDVRRGTTTFDGSRRLDPLLDIEATHRVRDVTILAFVTGRVSDPILRLDSEPSLEEDDVLSYLFLGRPADEAGTGTGSLDAAAAALASGLAVKQIAGLLGESLPIDTLDVRIGEQGIPEEVRVGAYVTPNVFMRYGRTFGSDPINEVGMELRLSDQWSIESEMGSDASAGADLIWSIDF